jgi:hypothetical protein
MNDPLPILIEQEWSWFDSIKEKYAHMMHSHNRNISSTDDNLSTDSDSYPQVFHN